LVMQDHVSAATQAFLSIAATVLAAVEAGEGIKPRPRIVFED